STGRPSGLPFSMTWSVTPPPPAILCDVIYPPPAVRALTQAGPSAGGTRSAGDPATPASYTAPGCGGAIQLGQERRRGRRTRGSARPGEPHGLDGEIAFAEGVDRQRGGAVFGKMTGRRHVDESIRGQVRRRNVDRARWRPVTRNERDARDVTLACG